MKYVLSNIEYLPTIFYLLSYKILIYSKGPGNRAKRDIQNGIWNLQNILDSQSPSSASKESQEEVSKYISTTFYLSKKFHYLNIYNELEVERIAIRNMY